MLTNPKDRTYIFITSRRSVPNLSIRLISLFIAFSFFFSTSDLSVAGQNRPYHTLAPQSIAKIVSDFEGDSSFKEEWAEGYAAKLAARMVDRVLKLHARGVLSVSLDDGKNELVMQLTELFRRGAISSDRLHLLRSAVLDEFDRLATPPKPQSQSIEVSAPVSQTAEKIEWLSVEEATRQLNALPHLGDHSMKSLKDYYRKLESEGVSTDEFLRRVRPDLARMAYILKRTRPVDELNRLVDNNQLVMDGEDAGDPLVRDRQIKRLDILRSVSEFLLQLLSSTEGVDNISHLKYIKSVFAKYPKESRQLVKYFEARFDPSKSLNERGEASGNIRDKYIYELSILATENLGERRILEKALGILIAAVKTDYFVEGRTGLFFGIVPRAIVRDDEDRALVRTPPYSIIWVHVPYGAYGAHARYANVARGGLRMINPDRTAMRDQILHECAGLSITQHQKHSSIPEGGSKGTFIYEKGLNPIAAGFGYGDALINCMMDNERIAVSSGATAIDPLELGPDEGTEPFANLFTVRAWMKGLDTWRLLMTSKSRILGGFSHKENDLLDPPEAGNRVTSQGVMHHAYECIGYLRDTGRIKSGTGEPINLTFTGGLDGDVGSGNIRQAINLYGEKAVIRMVVDGSGVMVNPEGLPHDVLLSMYHNDSVAADFPADRIGKGGFVARVVKGAGPSEENYIVLDRDATRSLNTRALDPEVLDRLKLTARYKAQARLKEDEPLITVLERDDLGHPSRVKVHTTYLRDIAYFLVRSDMLITGGGVSNSVNKDNYDLALNWDGNPIWSGMTNGANIFIDQESTLALEKKGVYILRDFIVNSVGVEVSSRVEVIFNQIFDVKDLRPDIMASFFAQSLAKFHESAGRKFWAMLLESEGRPADSVAIKVATSLSTEIIRLSELILKSDIVGDQRSNYGEPVIEMLRKYIPDVSAIDKEYPGTLDRVFARMSAEHLKALVSKMIAEDVVMTMGAASVTKLARMTGAKDIDIIKAYLETAHRLRTGDDIKAITGIENKETLSPRQRLAKFADARQRLKFEIEESFAATDSIIDNVRSLTGQVSAHRLLKPEGSIELASMAVVMKKDLAESVTGEKRMAGLRGNTLKDQYRIMRQDLRKLFAGGEGVAEVETADELIARTNELIAKGMKVIVLDDGSLTNGLDPASISGRKGEQYCFITSSRFDAEDEILMPFVNLNAMAMMGVGVIYNDLTLFEIAYKTFTGKEIDEDLIAKLVNKVLWAVKALPRCVKITNELPDQRKLRKLFEASA